MGQNPLVEDLRRTALFSRLEPESLAELGRIARVRRIDAGEVLFAAGDPDAGFFVLLEGRIKLYKISPEGKEYILRMVRAGETFAEAVAFSGLRYPVFAEALEPCRLVRFEVNEFRQLIHRTPQLALNMIATMAELLHALTVKIEDLSLREVGARLCRHLLELAEGDAGALRDGLTLELETTKTALAARIGTISETLSRTFRKLQQQGLLLVERNRVTLLDCRRLREVAEGDVKL
ncbi:MAG TPA: Crp/Fnr family transcriptional regulator [Syntrophobacteria bacterium]|nr:Crp/Fnr family transcriptional regulator [Syntrophobacteria bacterium]